MRLPDVPANNRFRILVVEDDPAILKLVSIQLQLAKFDPFAATNGTEGLAKFAQVDPHLVITDINMPGLSGHELVEKIRTTSAIPILMITAADSDDSQMKGFKLGADDYIAKPFNPTLLMARVIANLRRVYRYSAAVNSQTANTPTTRPGLPLRPPAKAEEAPSGGLPSGWAKCDQCGYLGPESRFQTQDVQGNRIVQCPNCKNREIMFSL